MRGLAEREQYTAELDYCKKNAEQRKRSYIKKIYNDGTEYIKEARVRIIAKQQTPFG